MDDCYGKTKFAVKIQGSYHKGQKILYQGNEAQVIDVEPVFTIMMNGRSHLICGDILDKVKPLLG